MDFFIYVPPMMHFGPGKAKAAGPIVKGTLGCSKAFVVYDKGVKAAGLVDGIVASLKAAGISTEEYDGVVPNPTDVMTNEGGRRARAFGADVVVAIGGGSSMDTAKGVAALATNDIDSVIKLEGAVGLKRSLPLVVVPTTSGTGSEATIGAVITDTTREPHRKATIGGPASGAQIAILDPELCLGIPPHVTAATGMDALTHAIDNMWCVFHNPIVEAWSAKVIEMVVKYLPLAVRDGSCLEAREHMHIASCMAGMAMNTGLGMVHNIAHCLGGQYNMAHGVANAIILPYGMEYMLPRMPEKFVPVAKNLGVYKEGMSPVQAGEAAIAKIKAMKKELGIPTLKSQRVDDDGLRSVAAASLHDTLYKCNAVKFSAEDAYQVLKRALEDEESAIRSMPF